MRVRKKTWIMPLDQTNSLPEVGALVLLIHVSFTHCAALDKLVQCTVLTLSAATVLKIDSGVYLIKPKMMIKMIIENYR